VSKRSFVPEPGGASTAGALTHVHTLADVERPEDLPPEVAREIAELVSSRRQSIVRWLKDSLVWWLLTGVSVGAGQLVSEAFYVFVLVFAFLPFSRPWRRQLYRVLQDRLRELGLSRRARVRIVARVESLLGRYPRLDPDERPSAERVLELLAPQRDRLGEHVDAPVLTREERERDDVRLAALGYLRYSKVSVGVGWAMGSVFTALGGLVALSRHVSESVPGLIIAASGLGIVTASTFNSYTSMRRAIPHVEQGLLSSWRLWKRVRKAAKRVDKTLPDTERAERIAALLIPEKTG
jgi:hypothetical protein